MAHDSVMAYFACSMQNKDEEIYNALLLIALQFLELGEPSDVIEKHLLDKHDDLVLITVVIKEAKNAHYARLRKQGFRLVLVGCITGLSGFFVTLLNFNTSRSVDIALYGLTTAGLAIVFWGLFKIIG